MKDRAPIAEFFVQPFVRSGLFLNTTIALIVDVAMLAFVIAHSFRHWDLLSVLGPLTLWAFATAMLVWAWWNVIRIHKFIHMLFEDGRIGRLEKGSVLAVALGQLSWLMTVLWVVFIAFMLGLNCALLVFGHPR